MAEMMADGRMMAEILLESSIISKMVEEERKMEEDLDFLYDNNVCQKKDDENEKVSRRKIKPYSTTRIKSKNFLSSISYTGIKEEGLYDRNFIFDV